MHHFRGTLLQGDETRLAPANAYIQYLTNSADGGHGWAGYLLVAGETDVEPGGLYTLVLSDGRSGELQVEVVSPDESGKYRATFVGEGSLK